jgi:hypothetical protein
MRKYLHRKLRDYLELYIRPEDSVLEVDPIPSARNGRITRNLRFQAPGQASSVLLDLDALNARDLGYVVLNGNIHYEPDVQHFLAMLHPVLQRSTRVIIAFYSSLWRPLLRLATILRLRVKTPEQNWIAVEDLENLLLLSDYELVRLESKLLIPIYIPLLSESVIVPARNEAGNIEAAILRTPKMGPDDELIFIEGNSTDNSWEKIVQMKEKYGAQRNICIARQNGQGKGDAVRKGFALASRDVLMILDADLTTPPEELPRFYAALVSDKGEFINGSRLVYPMEKQAMRFLNMVANKFFALMFSFVLGQRFKDTLCGTKVLTRENYLKIAAHRKIFGDFDPFGDFDLIFGAARLALRFVEVPVHYHERIYGETNIERWKHGAILLQMLVFAAKRIKFI